MEKKIEGLEEKLRSTTQDLLENQSALELAEDEGSRFKSKARELEGRLQMAEKIIERSIMNSQSVTFSGPVTTVNITKGSVNKADGHNAHIGDQYSK